jgi:hypothetical protein
MPGPAPSLRLGGSARHWWHADAPGYSIEIDPVWPGYTANLARALTRAREICRILESERPGTLRQIGGAGRLRGTR